MDILTFGIEIKLFDDKLICALDSALEQVQSRQAQITSAPISGFRTVVGPVLQHLGRSEWPAVSACDGHG